MLSPVNEPIPSDTNDPMPAASSPGTSRSGSLAPPIPDASIRITAAISGELNTNDTAAKLPAAATRVMTWGWASLRARWMKNAPSPEPSAISGASGPSTRPSPIVANAASRTPDRSGMVGGGPPVARPLAGMWPPRPGSFSIATAVMKAAIGRIGSGHQRGSLEYPKACGRWTNTSCWIWWINSRKHQEASETTTPTIATSTSSTTNGLLLIIALA